MSTRKTLESNVEELDEEENEHARLMNEQDEYEKQSLQHIPHLDEDEYTRMVQLSENYGKLDVNMEDFENNDDNEEEKIPVSSSEDYREQYQQHKNDDQDSKFGNKNHKHFDEQRSTSEVDISPQKKHQTPTSSFVKRSAFTRDSDASSKFQTPYRYSSEVSFGKASDFSSKAFTSLRRDPSEVIRQDVVEQVKVRIEELQSKMKSKSDMFYVMRHMCKKFCYSNQFRRLSSA